MLSKLYTVSIDFGQSGSSFAFSETNIDKNIEPQIYNYNNWPGCEGRKIKIPTIIILDENEEFFKFGHDARRWLIENQSVRSKFGFSEFKMKLLKISDLSKEEDLMVDDDYHIKKISILVLIRETLKYIKDTALSHFKTLKPFCESENIQWVLTVPAIWSDKVKNIMRFCAEEAGLCGKNDFESLTLCLEPEAGAYQSIKELSIVDSESIKVGDHILVIDVGGGTADFIDGKFESISIPFGGSFGSTEVNKNFTNFLVELFGEEIRNQFSKPQFIFKVLDSFDTFKKGIENNGQPTRLIPIIPSHLGISLETILSKIQVFNSRHYTNINFNRNYLSLPYQLILDRFFQPLFDNITNCVKQQIKTNSRMSKIDHISLIGGFCENKLLQDHIRKELGTICSKFFIPKRPELAVQMGAVRFGICPNTIKRTISMTYAVEIMEKLSKDPKKYSGRKTVSIGEVEYVPNIADTFVKANTMIGTDEIVTKIFYPTTIQQKEVVISIFYSPLENIEYTTDPGVHYLGSLPLPIPVDGGTLEERGVEVNLVFGLTEIKVWAVHLKTGKKFDLVINMQISREEAERRNLLRLQQLKPPSVQMAILMDCTGSMGPYIDQCKSKIDQLLDLLSKCFFDIILEVSFVGYRDYSDPNRFEIFQFTNNLPDLKKSIQNILAGGGGDTSEDIAGGLLKVLNLDWKNNFIKLLVHVADCPCHGLKYHNIKTPLFDSYLDGDIYGLVPENLITEIRQKGIDYKFVKLTNHTDVMLEIFKEAYNTEQRQIQIQDISDHPGKLIPTFINFISTSIIKLDEQQLDLNSLNF
eukprot:gene7549-9282_t